MASAALATQIDPDAAAPISERTLVFKHCKAAFEEIQKHGTPPDPVTYAVWYAYVARDPSAVRMAVDKTLNNGGTLDRYELNEIYREHLGKSETDNTNEAIGKQFEDSMESVSKLLEAGISQNTHFRTTLNDLKVAPSSEVQEEDFNSALEQLITESQKMSSVSSRLTEGL